MSKYSWLVERPWCSEDGYPSQILYNSLKILSGSQTFPTEPCILRSSIGTAKKISREGRQNVAMFLGREVDSFDFVSFAKKLGSFGLNQYFELFPLWQLRKGIRIPPYWMRSNDGWKKIGGQRIDKFAQLDAIEASENTICVVAPLQNIVDEHRFVIVGGLVISGSIYLPDEAPTTDEAYFFAQSFVDGLDEPFDLTYTLDLARLSDQTFRVIEVNSSTTSGWYGCDVLKCCTAIAEILDQENSLQD